MIVPVRLKNGNYDIHISNTAYSKLGKELTDRKGRYFLVADKLAFKFHGNRLLETINEKPAGIFQVHGEEEKNLTTLSEILESIAEAGITRGDCLVAFGGGVCGDITGFAAAVFMRGIDFYQVPTTLLSQVDSSVGGKTGVDLKAGKNLAGGFKQPENVYIDTSVLETLGEKEIRQGKAEMIKAAAIYDANLFRQFEISMDINEKNIGKCIEIKLAFVQGDEFDMGNRMILNFGHTIAHGLENTIGYGAISHGEAVAIGMVISTAMSQNAGLTEKGTAERVRKLIVDQGLPVTTEIALKDLSEVMKLDKKIKNGILNAVFWRESVKLLLKV